MPYRDEDAPTLNEINRDDWEDALQRPPKWVKYPLALTRPRSGYHGGPQQTVTCAEHPNFHITGGSGTVLYWAEQHVRAAHAGADLPPLPADPWAEGMAPSPDVPF